MIRINLLAVERRVGWGIAPLQVARKLPFVCSLIVLVAALVIGWRFRVLARESTRVDAEIASARQEAARLREVIVQVQQFEQRRAQLQQRVTLIEQLRQDQTGPVHLLDEVSRALPPMLWLTSLRQSPDGGEVTIEGRCIALTGLSDLIASLEASRYFKRPVDIVNSQRQMAAGGGEELITFVIKATFQQPGAAVRTPANAPPRTGP